MSGYIISREIIWTFCNIQEIMKSEKDLYFRQDMEVNFFGDSTKWELICRAKSKDMIEMLIAQKTSIPISVDVKFYVDTEQPTSVNNIKTFLRGDSFVRVASYRRINTILSEEQEQLPILLCMTFKELTEHQTSKYQEGWEKYGILLRSPFYSDFTLICADGFKIPVHQCILATNSPVFDSMFKASMQETASKVAIISDIDGNVMTKLLEFIYTGKVFDLDIVAPELIYAAEKYQLNALKQLCAESMIKNLGAENAAEYITLAERFGLSRLYRRCIGYIKEKFHDCRLHGEWTKLSAEVLLRLVDCLGNDFNHPNEFSSSIKDATEHLPMPSEN